LSFKSKFDIIGHMAEKKGYDFSRNKLPEVDSRMTPELRDFMNRSQGLLFGAAERAQFFIDLVLRGVISVDDLAPGKFYEKYVRRAGGETRWLAEHASKLEDSDVNQRVVVLEERLDQTSNAIRGIHVRVQRVEDNLQVVQQRTFILWRAVKFLGSMLYREPKEDINIDNPRLAAGGRSDYDDDPA